MTPQRVSEMEQDRRRRAVLGAAVSIALAWIVLAAVYYLLPIGSRYKGDAIARAAVGAVLFVLALLRQIRKVLKSDVPGCGRWKPWAS